MSSTRPRLIAQYGRTVLGAIVGAAAGAAYAHFIGCRTGTCAITSSVWTAAAFFGFTGAVVAHPSPPRDPHPGDPGAEPGPESAGR